MNETPSTESEKSTQIPLSPPQAATGVSLITTIAVAAILSAFSGVVSWDFASKSTAGKPQVVVLDAARIAEARMKVALSKNMSGAGEAAKEGQEFMRQFNSEIDSYSDQGVVVINSAVTLNHPPGVDVTAAVAARLGIDLR